MRLRHATRVCVAVRSRDVARATQPPVTAHWPGNASAPRPTRWRGPRLQRIVDRLRRAPGWPAAARSAYVAARAVFTCAISRRPPADAPDRERLDVGRSCFHRLAAERPDLPAQLITRARCSSSSRRAGPSLPPQLTGRAPAGPHRRMLTGDRGLQGCEERADLLTTMPPRRRAPRGRRRAGPRWPRRGTGHGPDPDPRHHRRRLHAGPGPATPKQPARPGSAQPRTMAARPRPAPMILRGIGARRPTGRRATRASRTGQVRPIPRKPATSTRRATPMPAAFPLPPADPGATRARCASWWARKGARSPPARDRASSADR